MSAQRDVDAANLAMSASLREAWEAEQREFLLAGGKDAPDATAAYLEAEDGVAAWVEECCCRRDPNAFETQHRPVHSWNDWATKHGEYVGTNRFCHFRYGASARGRAPPPVHSLATTVS